MAGATFRNKNRDRTDAAARATGHVRTIERRDGPVFYAKLKLADGTEPQRRLGKAWTKRTKPPEGYLTRGMAETRVSAMLAGDDPLVNIAPSRVNFGHAVAEWLVYVEHEKRIRPSTLRDYSNTAHHHLVPRFGAATPVDSITRQQIEQFRSDLLRAGDLAPRTVQKVLVLLRGVLDQARRRGWIEHNPAADVRSVRTKRSGDFRVLDPGEVALLGSHAANAQDAALFTVAAFTGLRLGELLALRWGDVDFSKRIVHVRRSYVLGREDTPKSHKVRSVPLIDQAAVALDGLSLRERFTGDDDRVFANDIGDVLGQDLLRRRFHAALKAAGIKPLRLHDLRHSFGTLAVQAFPLSDVQAFMGHANIATTMLYVHHTPQHDAADKLSALVAAAESVPPAVPRTVPVAA
jgi:integrase